MQLTIISATIAIAMALACGWYSRRLALEKGRNASLWTLLGLVLTVIAVPVLVLLPVALDATAEEPPGQLDDASPTSGDCAPPLEGPV